MPSSVVNATAMSTAPVMRPAKVSAPTKSSMPNQPNSPVVARRTDTINAKETRDGLPLAFASVRCALWRELAGELP
ncbi:hypothetical protein ACH40D_20430 [Streptomyces olivaceoviridis]|uniref:Uncharacterized protein n=1 Tax=Streptomyces olivaceoviridis TaxID=1921 RepID=A0ABW7V3D8_STROI|nr:hypothetical protein [Streptomyces corchorusii]